MLIWQMQTSHVNFVEIWDGLEISFLAGWQVTCSELIVNISPWRILCRWRCPREIIWRKKRVEFPISNIFFNKMHLTIWACPPPSSPNWRSPTLPFLAPWVVRQSCFWHLEFSARHSLHLENFFLVFLAPWHLRTCLSWDIEFSAFPLFLTPGVFHPVVLVNLSFPLLLFSCSQPRPFLALKIH